MADLNDVIKRLRAEGDLSRNSGTHSIKSVKEILLAGQKASLSDAEDRRESKRNEEKQLEILSGLSSGGSLSANDAGGAQAVAGKGGLLKAAGGLLSGIGIGGGALAAGIGIMAAGGGYLLNEVGEMDAESIKKKVTTLLSIGDSFEGGNWEVLKDGGSFALAMTGIGLGLAAFSIGSGVAAAIETFTKDSTYATTIKSQVKELLSIAEFVAGDSGVLAQAAFVGKGASFLVAMTGLGLGLAVFSVGSAAGKAAELIKAEGWAQSIKDSVVTLMSIEETVGGEKGSSFVGESARFLLAMTGIGLGLAAFGIGSAVGGLSESITKFSTGSDWSQKIKDNIITLMSIENELGGKAAAFGESGTFLAVMTGLGAGLAAFGFGSTVVGVSEGINHFTGVEGENWAQKVKDNVKTLVSITPLLDGDGEGSKAGLFASGLAKIGLGLAAFGVGNAFGHLAGAASAILEMFGVKSPFTQVMSIAEKSDELTKGADALTKISAALETFSNIKISKVRIDFKSLAMDLGEAIPFLTALSTGGTLDPSWWPTGELDFGPEGKGGLLNPDLKLDALSAAIQKINFVLSGGAGTTPLSVEQITESAGATSVAIDAATQLAAEGVTAANARLQMQSQRNPHAPSNNIVNNNTSNTNIVSRQGSNNGRRKKVGFHRGN